jgi:hypothetical protein
MVFSNRLQDGRGAVAAEPMILETTLPGHTLLHRRRALAFTEGKTFMYEPKTKRPLSRGDFLQRLAQHFFLATVLLVGSLGVGIWGYHHFEQLSGVDAFLNAAMLLGGMGPVNPPLTTAGKLFAGCYALYAGLVFIVTAALVFTPIVHRVLHRFHWVEKV